MPAHAAWQNPLHRIVVLAALLLLLLGAGHRYAPSDSLETLRAFTSTARFGGPRRPFLSSTGASHGPYSTHKCIGGSDIAPSLSAAAQTRCHFKNVCLTLLPTLLANNTNVEATSVRLEYFRPPELERLDVPVQWNMRFEQTKSWTRLGRDSAVVPEIKFTSIPSHYKWSEAKVAVASESFWPENYGHSLGDDFFPIYRLYKHFYTEPAWTRDLQVILHPGCKGRGWWEERGCSHEMEVGSALLDRAITTEEDVTFWGTDGRVCFEQLLVGSRTLGMGFPSENAWEPFINLIKHHYGHPTTYRPRKQKISIIFKHGRRTFTNYDQLRVHLERKFQGVEVEVIEPAVLEIEEQIRAVRDTTVIVSPCGGVSFTAMFLSPGVSAVFADYWDSVNNQSAQMEKHIFAYQSSLTSFSYPVEFNDLSWDDSKIFPLFLLEEHHALKMRDWTNVTINLERMEHYVYAVLQTRQDLPSNVHKRLEIENRIRPLCSTVASIAPHFDTMARYVAVPLSPGGSPAPSTCRATTRRSVFILCALLLLGLVGWHVTGTVMKSVLPAARQPRPEAASPAPTQLPNEVTARPPLPHASQPPASLAMQDVSNLLDAAQHNEVPLPMPSKIIVEDLPVPSTARRCPSTPAARELLNAISLASAWQVSDVTSTGYSIRPVVEVDTALKPCLAHAIFTTRLLSLPSASIEFIYLLPPAVYLPHTGSYHGEIPTLAEIPRETYRVEVRLDFGSLEGAREGFVCGRDAVSCDPKALGKAKGVAEDALLFQGVALEIEGSNELVLGGRTDFATTIGERCNDFASLDQGFWLNKTYQPVPTCSLIHPSLPLLLPPSTSTTGPIWISFVGDSNPRNVFSRFVRELGAGRAQWGFVAIEGEHKGGVVANGAFRARDGKGWEKDTLPEVIITWSWWFEDNSVDQEGYCNNSRAATELVDVDLGTYLVRTGMRDGMTQRLSPAFMRRLEAYTKDVRASRTYFSLGSHSEHITSLGTSRFLDVLLSPSYLSPDVLERAAVKVLTTTSVISSKIPIARFPHQDLVRNNEVIRARNDVLRSRLERTGRMVDLGGITEGITSLYNREGRKPDAVHFPAFVYDEMVRILWTELGWGRA